ncbi:3-phosphoshikimate 1-carboxyvinyltransferase [Bacillus thuringiensis]|uniref:3-phosphoshikimate 1-carboxyvinyltransferase n=1 Tax=Bacillus thuringiensis TaxID=1428 RepID=UPI00104F474D|nr:3-phosphoshikimate 1-carboxyvinyltransferase [Bacillus thuringiensis]
MILKQLLTTSKLSGEITVPGDKSISHRAVIFGALAHGKTKITGFLRGEDCLNTIRCFQKLGVNIAINEEYIEILGKGIESFTAPNQKLHVGNSGTTIRLLLGILANTNFSSILVGDDSIAKRPMKRVVEPLQKMGALIEGEENGEFAPLYINGRKLKGIDYKMNVPSAQVKSSILLAGMLADGITIIIDPFKTRNHTEKMIEAFGGKLKVSGDVITIEGNQRLEGTEFTVPGDISSAAFFIVAATIIPDSEIIIRNVGLNYTRTGIIDALLKMGASIKILNKKKISNEDVGDIIVRSSDLKGIMIDGDLIPRLIDEIPILALAATQAEGETIIKNAEELKVKESNRIDTVVNELKKLGVNIEATDDGMIIEGKSQLIGGIVDSHHDHRIGMMLSIANLLTNNEIKVCNKDAVNISYPNFFENLNNLLK